MKTVCTMRDDTQAPGSNALDSQTGFTRIEEVSLDGCSQAADALDASGTGWHIHSLSPDCRYNPRPGNYAFVVEDEGSGVGYMAFTAQQPRELNIALLKRLHGDSVLDKSATTAKPGDAAARALLQRVEDLAARGVPWHHHVLAPRCCLNPARGRWVIAVEAPEAGFPDCAAFDAEPSTLIAAIEQRYFG
jgi:hypothetical protein